MATPFLFELREILAMSNDAEQAGSLECKHFFGGAAAYIGGKIFMTLTPVGLAFKLPDSLCRTLLEDDAVPLRYFPSAPVKRGYVLFENPDELAESRRAALIAKSISYVLRP